MCFIGESLIARLGCLKITCLSVLIVALTCPLRAQTYTVGSDSSAKPQAKSTKTPSSARPAQTAPPGQPLGWGSNIQNARLARAAVLALQKGDHALAFSYAQRAVQATPNDPKLWFLFGYTARLDAKAQVAIDAYNHGLRLSPSDVEGLSGLAQTYTALGQNDQAEQ